MLCILVLAAGQSSRMRGADKLLEPVDGVACLRLLAQRALKVTDDVLVTVPDPSHPRVALLSDLPVTCLPVPDAASGMSASLRAGIAALPARTTAAMILPADMPEISAADMAQLWAVYQASGLSILQGANAEGVPGHPVIFSHRLFPEFRDLSGDKGAAGLIRKHANSHGLFELPGNHAVTDLDTPEEWLAWRSKKE